MQVDRGQSLKGRRCLLTGASSGIGLATARALARRGATLLIVGRDRGRMESARALIGAELPKGCPEPEIEIAELSLMEEVAALAARIAARGPLDLLVNCAGIYTARRTLTAEGLETQFAVNHLAPFLLTTRLLPALEAAPEARIVTVSSESHYAGKIRWKDPLHSRFYLGLRAYEQSKLANALFSAELARRLGPESRVGVFTADPGLVNTEMGQKGGLSFSGLVWSLRKRWGTSPDQPAEAIAYLATEPGLRVRSGCYFRDGAELLPSARARDPEAARRLWALSEELVARALAARSGASAPQNEASASQNGASAPRNGAGHDR